MDSPITQIHIKNFRCLEELTINFQVSPIVALYAGNDSGKSSAVKAIESVLYNDERDIKNYIRTGTTGFSVTVTLADGTVVERIKTNTANSYTLYQNGVKINTWDRISSDVPDLIKKVFNVRIEDNTGELLNLRTCESLLIFSLTKTTDNYKIVHDCISSQLIEEAYNVGNEQIKNQLNTIRKCTDLRDGYLEQIGTYKPVEQDVIDHVTNIRTELSTMADYKATVTDTLFSKLKLDDTKQNVAAFNVAKLTQLEQLKFSDKELTAFDSLVTLHTANNTLNDKKADLHTEQVSKLIDARIDDKDIDKLSLLQDGVALLKSVSNKKANIPDSSIIDKLDTLRTELQSDYDNYHKLNDLRALSNNLSTARKNEETANQNLQEAKDEFKSSIDVRYDSEVNALVKNCEHCNSEVFFNLNDLEIITNGAIDI